MVPFLPDLLKTIHDLFVFHEADANDVTLILFVGLPIAVLSLSIGMFLAKEVLKEESRDENTNEA